MIFFLLALFVASLIVSTVGTADQPLKSVDKACENARKDAMGICPPFYLLDQEGKVINPVKGINADVSYSSGKAMILTGDYFKSKWAQSGVIEADCLICHLKDYNNEKRKEQIKALNYQWAADVGGGFAEIEGKVIKGKSRSRSGCLCF